MTRRPGLFDDPAERRQFVRDLPAMAFTVLLVLACVAVFLGATAAPEVGR